MQTVWNTAFYCPPTPTPKKPRKVKRVDKTSYRQYNNGNYNEGELYGLVYAAVIEGTDRMAEIAKRVNRTPQLVMRILHVLYAGGYVTYTVESQGSVRWNVWKPVEKFNEEEKQQ